MAAAEEAQKKLWADPETKALSKKSDEIVESMQMEFLWKLESKA